MVLEQRVQAISGRQIDLNAKATFEDLLDANQFDEGEATAAIVIDEKIEVALRPPLRAAFRRHIGGPDGGLQDFQIALDDYRLLLGKPIKGTPQVIVVKIADDIAAAREHNRSDIIPSYASQVIYD